MIKETCGCGATLSIDQGQYMKDEEIKAAAAWRLNHRHESRTVAQESPKVSSEVPNTLVPLCAYCGSDRHQTRECPDA